MQKSRCWNRCHCWFSWFIHHFCRSIRPDCVDVSWSWQVRQTCEWHGLHKAPVPTFLCWGRLYDQVNSYQSWPQSQGVPSWPSHYKRLKKPDRAKSRPSLQLLRWWALWNILLSWIHDSRLAAIANWWPLPFQRGRQIPWGLQFKQRLARRTWYFPQQREDFPRLGQWRGSTQNHLNAAGSWHWSRLHKTVKGLHSYRISR